jgi:uncharacterized membrane protein
MSRRLRIGAAVAVVLLVYGSVLVFLAFDRNSHSNSDTLLNVVVH